MMCYYYIYIYYYRSLAPSASKLRPKLSHNSYIVNMFFFRRTNIIVGECVNVCRHWENKMRILYVNKPIVLHSNALCVSLTWKTRESCGFTHNKQCVSFVWRNAVGGFRIVPQPIGHMWNVLVIIAWAYNGKRSTMRSELSISLVKPPSFYVSSIFHTLTHTLV